MRNSDCGMRNQRTGVTIIEVLFAIMVTSIGLLGALTLLPVAATQARKARTADASTSAVTAAVGYFDAMGMRRPQSWVAYDAQINGNTTNTGDPRFPWAEYQAFLANPGGPQPPLRRNWFGGFDSFCIDPRMTAANQENPTNPALGVVVVSAVETAATFPRKRASATDPAMWRLGLSNGGTVPMNRLMADGVFMIDDDLNYDRFSTDAFGQRVHDDSSVAQQIWDILPVDQNLPPLSQRKTKRRIDGHLSWMATLVPKLERYSVVPTDTYVLSIVVFYDRPANMSISFDPLNERAIEVGAMPGSGVMGGEVVLSWTIAQSPANDETAKEQLNVHTNEWIMLAGTAPHQLGGNVPIFKWYRVSDIEPEIEYNAALGRYERYVTLTGQDWAATSQYAVAMQGVVAVVEKTIRLEP